MRTAVIASSSTAVIVVAIAMVLVTARPVRSAENCTTDYDSILASFMANAPLAPSFSPSAVPQVVNFIVQVLRVVPVPVQVFDFVELAGLKGLIVCLCCDTGTGRNIHPMAFRPVKRRGLLGVAYI